MFYLKDHWISPSLSTVLFKHIQLQFSLRHNKKKNKKNSLSPDDKAKPCAFERPR